MNKCVTTESVAYPPLLREIGSIPSPLYYKGEWRAELFERCLAVVGSRKMTSYGRAVTERIVYDVAAAGVTIVSGFMYGVDATAHKAALDAGGKTIAVMAGGVGFITPADQVALYARILAGGGLVISEYDGKMPPQPWGFPRRNRIVAGLAHAVLVVEAAADSGSLITADYALRFGRALLAVPGNVTSLSSKGTLGLLQSGARLVVDSADILSVFGLKPADAIRENKILAILDNAG